MQFSCNTFLITVFFKSFDSKWALLMLLLITFKVLIFVWEAPPDISALSYKPRAYKFMYKQQFMFTYEMKKPLLQDVKLTTHKIIRQYEDDVRLRILFNRSSYWQQQCQYQQKPAILHPEKKLCNYKIKHIKFLGNRSSSWPCDLRSPS